MLGKGRRGGKRMGSEVRGGKGGEGKGVSMYIFKFSLKFPMAQFNKEIFVNASRLFTAV